MKIYRIPETLGCLIFDIDSTLYTNETYAREQVDVQVRRFADLRGQSFEEADRLVREYRAEHERKTGKKISLGNTLAAFGVPIGESIRWREDLLEPADYLASDERLRATLSALAGRYALAAVTNNPVLPALKTLKALGVEDFFPVLIGLDSTGFSKPHREPFLRAANLTATEIERCLAIGDRFDLDVALPLELGMGGILVDGVEDVYTLPDLLG
jgi:phosphoglycolate phosphatase/putative hydrolase of the HAD superfamily